MIIVFKRSKRQTKLTMKH